MPGSAAPHVDALFSAAYEELRRLASAVRSRESSVTLSPTALVNEAWLKLSARPGTTAKSPLHFKRIAARAMRQVLIEAARRRNARKRGAGDVAMVTFEEGLEQPDAAPDDVLALHEALERLGRFEPRQAAMVEQRFFGGLGVEEIAELNGVSEATVLRDWRAARAWLAREIRRDA